MEEIRVKETKLLNRTFDKKDTLVVKGLAILLMLFYHLFESEELLVSMQVNHLPFSREFFLMMSGFGNICVALFAFLSAYGITKGLIQNDGDDSLKDVYREAHRRFCRLAANFAVMYVSVNLVWFSHFNYAGLYGTGWQGGMFALLDLFGLAQLFGTPTLNMTWWYMELAVIIIFAVPLLYRLVKRLGNYTIILGLLLPYVVELNEDVSRYILVVVVGVICAYSGWFEKLFALMPGAKGKIVKVLLAALLLAVSVPVRQNYMVHTYFLWIVDAPVTLILAWFCGELLRPIPLLTQVLQFLGKHSMNIFFVHTFFYMAIHQKFIYSFRYAGLIFLVLVLISLGYSVALEAIKKCGLWLLRKVGGLKNPFHG